MKLDRETAKLSTEIQVTKSLKYLILKEEERKAEVWMSLDFCENKPIATLQRFCIAVCCWSYVVKRIKFVLDSIMSFNSYFEPLISWNTLSVRLCLLVKCHGIHCINSLTSFSSEGPILNLAVTLVILRSRLHHSISPRMSYLQSNLLSRICTSQTHL